MKKKHLLHFRPEENSFVERSLDWVRQVSIQHQVVSTPFLDPREQFILTSIARRETDIKAHVDGGYVDAERCRVRLALEYYYLEEEEFSLAFLRLTAETPLEHREVLGSLLGLGIQRHVLGDILPQPTFTDVILATEMKDYVIGSLTKVGRKAIIIDEIVRDRLMTEQDRGLEQQTTVSSLRLDTIIAAICRLSRYKAVELVRLGRCKVNWQTMDRPNHLLAAGDVLSIRGFGRIQLKSVLEATKKGRFPIRFSCNL
jgi:RNA-binding protein YlmH